MVSDDEILEAYRLLASREGLFGEPASAASVAGLIKQVRQGLNLSDQRVVCIITGSGLKDPDLAVSSVTAQTIEVEPTMEAVEAAAPGPHKVGYPDSSRGRVLLFNPTSNISQRIF